MPSLLFPVMIFAPGNARVWQQPHCQAALVANEMGKEPAMSEA